MEENNCLLFTISLVLICLLLLAVLLVLSVYITITQEAGLKKITYYHINIK